MERGTCVPSALQRSEKKSPDSDANLPVDMEAGRLCRRSLTQRSFEIRGFRWIVRTTLSLRLSCTSGYAISINRYCLQKIYGPHIRSPRLLIHLPRNLFGGNGINFAAIKCIQAILRLFPPQLIYLLLRWCVQARK